MSDDSPRLYLFTPLIERADAFAPALEAALKAGDVACVFLRLAPMGESEAARAASLLVPIVQAHGAAALVADSRVAGRSGADGVHVHGRDEALLEALGEAVEAMKPKDRIVGAGGMRTRHDSMAAGEMDIDYVAFGDPTPDGWTPDADFVTERVAWWSAIFNVPCVGFASSLADVARIGEAGADFVALGDAVWNDPRGAGAAIADATRTLAAIVRTDAG